MNKSKECNISIVLISIALALYSISFITGLIPGLTYSIDKICMYLGFSCFALGLVFLYKSKDNDDNEEK